MDDNLARLVAEISKTKSYRHVTLDLVQRIGRRELHNHNDFAKALKATKNKLHQVGGAYHKLDIHTDKLLMSLVTGDVQAACMAAMRMHASTTERLDFLAEFYQTLFANLPPVSSILDVACGFNPFAIPWMGLSAATKYWACDIYTDWMGLFNKLWPRLGVDGHAFACDLGTDIPPHEVDVAFVFKTLTCLEQAEKGLAGRLLDGLNARVIIVTYPTRSLGGRGKGMAETYAAQMEALLAPRGWHYTTHRFPNELAYIIHKRTR